MLYPIELGVQIVWFRYLLFETRRDWGWRRPNDTDFQAKNSVGVSWQNEGQAARKADTITGVCCRSGFPCLGVESVPVEFPVITAHEGTPVGHAVELADAPVSTGLCEPLADQKPSARTVPNADSKSSAPTQAVFTSPRSIATSATSARTFQGKYYNRMQAEPVKK